MTELRKPGVHSDLEQQIISAQEKPALDEETFQQLLEAAHVLQEQKAFEAVTRPKFTPSEAIAKIVETQESLRAQPGDLPAAANLIAEHLQEITHATGVAIAVAHDDRLEYCAATGDAANLAGSDLLVTPSRASDGQLSTRFNDGHADEQSIALPLHHDGKLAGLLEVRFANADTIDEPDMRSCQLMAGLMTEAIARAADKEWRQALAAERAAMLEALERIKPQLERLAVGPAQSVIERAKKVAEPTESVLRPEGATTEPSPSLAISEASAKSGRETICPQCGYQFGEHELFCGRCGTARPAGTLPSGDLQSKWASMWHLQQEAETKQQEDVERGTDESQFSSPVASSIPPSYETPSELSPELQNMITRFSDVEGEPATEPESETALEAQSEPGGDEPPESKIVAQPSKAQSAWASASKAREWLESLESKSAAGIWLAKHRADVYVGAAVVLLLIVLSGWGLRPDVSHPQPKNPPQPNLTLFERLLVSLGLAETPPAPVYMGNPNASVWVDLHTALYYCSDSDLYGKTPGGKYTTQRDAQLDQFEPAARKNCD